MKQILSKEEYVQIPPHLMADPFVHMIRIVKEEIRKHKWIENEKGRNLTWDQAREEWMKNHYQDFQLFNNACRK